MPNENLDDFKSNAAAPAEPPRSVWLKFTGDIEVLKPLARYEDFVKTKTAADTSAKPGPPPFSWFHRTLAVGGALAIIAFLGTALLIRIYGPPVEPVSPINVANDQRPADILTPSEELDDSNLLSPVDSPFASEKIFAFRKAARPRRAVPGIFRNAYRPQSLVPHRQITALMSRPRFIVSEFVPTTLIIYIENGEIKTRIEPQLTAGYKKPLPPGN